MNIVTLESMKLLSRILWRILDGNHTPSSRKLQRLISAKLPGVDTLLTLGAKM